MNTDVVDLKPARKWRARIWVGDEVGVVTSKRQIREHIHLLVDVSRMPPHFLPVEGPNQEFARPLEAVDVEAVAYVELALDPGTGGFSRSPEHADMDILGTRPRSLEDVDLGRPSDAPGQEPECGPEAFAQRQARAHLVVAVRPPERELAGEAARCVRGSAQEWSHRLRVGGIRGYREHAAADTERLHAERMTGGAGKSCVHVDLLFLIDHGEAIVAVTAAPGWRVRAAADGVIVFE